jgi:hypothetical protein
MISGQQDIGDGQATKRAWPGVVRILKGSLGPEGFITNACLVSQNTGDEPGYGFDENHCWNFASREDVIADGDEFGLKQGDDPFVESFISAAKQDQARFTRERLHKGLIKPSPARG